MADVPVRAHGERRARVPRASNRARRSPTSSARTAGSPARTSAASTACAARARCLLDGDAVRSCLVFAVQADGADVTTIEGIGSPDGELSPVQAAFRDCHGLQCGFCTPGFVVTVTAFLRDRPNPTDDEIREALSGNLCRCTGYQGIVAAVHQAAATKRARRDRAPPPARPGTSARASTVSRTRACSPAPASSSTTSRCRECCTRASCAARSHAPRSAASTPRPRVDAARRALRVHRGRPESRRQGAVAHVDRRAEPRDAAAAARRGRGPFRRRSRRDGGRRLARARRGRRRARRRRLRAAARRRRLHARRARRRPRARRPRLQRDRGDGRPPALRLRRRLRRVRARRERVDLPAGVRTRADGRPRARRRLHARDRRADDLRRDAGARTK